VIRFAILYFAMLVLFLVLLIAPLIARNVIDQDKLPDIPLTLLQPIDSDNNDTMSSYTGSGLGKGFQPVASPPW
jgi:1,3-beta-glucan synthase